MAGVWRYVVEYLFEYLIIPPALKHFVSTHASLMAALSEPFLLPSSTEGSPNMLEEFLRRSEALSPSFGDHLTACASLETATTTVKQSNVFLLTFLFANVLWSALFSLSFYAIYCSPRQRRRQSNRVGSAHVST